jgi:hypothetical protein
MIATIVLVAAAFVLMGGVMPPGGIPQHRAPAGWSDPADRCPAQQYEQHPIDLIDTAASIDTAKRCHSPIRRNNAQSATVSTTSSR